VSLSPARAVHSHGVCPPVEEGENLRASLLSALCASRSYGATLKHAGEISCSCPSHGAQAAGAPDGAGAGSCAGGQLLMAFTGAGADAKAGTCVGDQLVAGAAAGGAGADAVPITLRGACLICGTIAGAYAAMLPGIGAFGIPVLMYCGARW